MGTRENETVRKIRATVSRYQARILAEYLAEREASEQIARRAIAEASEDRDR